MIDQIKIDAEIKERQEKINELRRNIKEFRKMFWNITQILMEENDAKSQ